MKNVWRSWGPGAALIILLTVVAYQPAIHGDFVFDDQLYVTNNHLVRADDGLYRIWFTTALGDYYPLTSTLWWFQWRLWGSNPMGYHVVNVVLHALDAVLVWLVLKELGIRGAWWAGLVFALHPVNVATAAWVSELKNTLSMFFGAVTVLLFLRFEQEARRRWYVLSLATFLLALLSKIAIVMLPFFLLGCVWWRRERIGRKDLLQTAPFFALSLVLALVEIWFNNRALSGHVVRDASIGSRLAAAGGVPWFYLYKALLPVNLTMIYPNWQIDASRWVSYLSGVALIGCFVLFWRKRKSWGRPLLFGLGYFVVMLVPVLGFVDQAFYQYALVADHWQYYSIVGAIALVVAAGESIYRCWGERGQYWGTAAGMALLLVLGAATWTRSCVYANEETFWSDNVARNPNAWVAQNGLGCARQERNPRDAISHFELALQLEPDYAEAHNNLGNTLLELGKVPEAVAHFEQALRIQPHSAQVHYNIAGALIRQGRLSEAIGHWEQALRIDPDYAEAHNNLAAALVQTGRLPEAMEHLEQALRLAPDYAEAHCNLGVALEQTGKIEDAIKHYEQAVRIKPDYVQAHRNLGNALLGLGKASEAIRQYEQVLRIAPDDAEVQNKLARLRAVQ